MHARTAQDSLCRDLAPRATRNRLRTCGRESTLRGVCRACYRRGLTCPSHAPLSNALLESSAIMIGARARFAPCALPPERSGGGGPGVRGVRGVLRSWPPRSTETLRVSVSYGLVRSPGLLLRRSLLPRSSGGSAGFRRKARRIVGLDGGEIPTRAIRVVRGEVDGRPKALDAGYSSTASTSTNQSGWRARSRAKPGRTRRAAGIFGRWPSRSSQPSQKQK